MNRREWCVSAGLASFGMLERGLWARSARGACGHSGEPSALGAESNGLQDEARLEKWRQRFLSAMADNRVPWRFVVDLPRMGDPGGHVASRLAIKLRENPEYTSSALEAHVFANSLAVGGRGAVGAIVEQLEKEKGGLSEHQPYPDLGLPRGITLLAALGTIGPEASQAAGLLESWLTDPGIAVPHLGAIRLVLANIRDEPPAKSWREMSVERRRDGKLERIEPLDLRDRPGCSILHMVRPRPWFGEELVEDTVRLLKESIDPPKDFVGAAYEFALARALGVLDARAIVARPVLEKMWAKIHTAGNPMDLGTYGLALARIDAASRRTVIDRMVNGEIDTFDGGAGSFVLMWGLWESCYALINTEIGEILTESLSTGCKHIALKAAKLLDLAFGNPCLPKVLDVVCGEAELPRRQLALRVAASIATFADIELLEQRLSAVDAPALRRRLKAVVDDINKGERLSARESLKWE